MESVSCPVSRYMSLTKVISWEPLEEQPEPGQWEYPGTSKAS